MTIAAAARVICQFTDMNNKVTMELCVYAMRLDYINNGVKVRFVMNVNRYEVATLTYLKFIIVYNNLSV